MTRTDHQILFTALGFIAVAMQAEAIAKNESAARAIAFAKLIEEFCRLNINNAFPPVDIHFVHDRDVTTIDAAIDKHINELRVNETTVLPQDKETLLTFYDRLQQRKTRRMQSAFYEIATPEMLANTILKYLDEEINDAEADT